jgi:hypothetical protein
MRRRLAEQLAFRGHITEASSVIGDRSVPVFSELAYLGAIAPATAQAVLGRWVRDDSGLARLAAAHWSARRDTTALGELLTRVTARARGGSTAPGAEDGDAQARARYDSASVLAHIALARGDSVAALARLLSLPDTLCPECYVDRLIRARLLTAAGRGAEAIAGLDEPLVAFLTPIEVVFALERARAARQAGDRGVAEAACRFVHAAWARGDSVLRLTASEVCPEKR